MYFEPQHVSRSSLGEEGLVEDTSCGDDGGLDWADTSREGSCSSSYSTVFPIDVRFQQVTSRSCLCACRSSLGEEGLVEDTSCGDDGGLDWADSSRSESCSSLFLEKLAPVSERRD